MKTKHLLAFAFLLVCGSAWAQWNVSTEVTNKNALVEEYTGIHCVYCPQAHKVVSDLIKAQGDKIYAIAIHAGSYATPAPDQPDFRTEEGEELNDHFGIEGYPAGMVNRWQYDEDYPSPLSSRDMWALLARLQTESVAPVNLWMSSSYDEASRKLTVNVEGYYTADVDATENMLNVVVTENNIMGPQQGGGVGSEYMHQHMARAWLTPTLGEAITNCKKGEYFSRQYIYDVPETINGVVVNPAEFEVIAFVCENDENVLNVIGCRPEYPGLELPLAADIADALIPVGDVYGYDFFDVQLTNRSTVDITSADFVVTFNNTNYDVAWTGIVPARTTATIRLPFEMLSKMKATGNKFVIKLTGLNGEEYKGNKYNGRFAAPYEATPSVKVELLTDIFADENRFLIKDIDGNVVAEIGPFEKEKMISTVKLVDLEPNTTYCFEITDTWSNGVIGGAVKLSDANNNVICQEDYISGFGYRTFFTTGDQNVSTEVQNKCVLIEEFTGIYCGNCPDAHVIIEELMKAQGDIIYPLAYHAGYYATPSLRDPDYRTAYGDSLDVYFKPDGCPNGMINRYMFEGEEKVMLNRGVWSNYSYLIANQEAPVNLWISSQYDSGSRMLTVSVEGYYTADVEPTANLNVVITQDKIIGPQNGATVNNDYVHNHMVRACLTPMWGDTIDSCKKGDTFKKKYTYVVPEDINGIATDPANFKVVAFVCNDKEDVLNVIGCTPDYPGLSIPMDAHLEAPLIPVGSTYGYNYYEALLVNNSTEDIIEAGFDITLNGNLYLTEWEGLAPARKTTLIKIPFKQGALIENNNDFTVKLGGVNYELYDGNSISGSFQDPLVTTPTNKFIIKTDNSADQNSYLIKDANGNVVYEFGPFPVGVVTEVTEMVTLEADQVYSLEIVDSWGDGILSPRGTCKIYNDKGKLVSQQLEIKGHGVRVFFDTTEESAVNTIDASTIEVRYNQASEAIEVNTGNEPAQVAVYNAAGQSIYQASAVQSPSIAVDVAGIYMVKVATATQQQVTKVVAY